MNREPILILMDIIKNGMSLNDNQIWIYNQDYNTKARGMLDPSSIHIVIQYNTTQNYASTNNFIPAENGNPAKENISMFTKEDYTINVVSKNDEARKRKEEVILSLNSNFSKNKQGEYQFKIANISNSFLNVSEVEGVGMLNRFAINISLLAKYDKIIETDYYDNFSSSIINN